MFSRSKFMFPLLVVQKAQHILLVSTLFITEVLYSAANDPETANDPRPQMIPKLDRKWSQDHKWSPQRIASHAEGNTTPLKMTAWEATQRTANDPAEKNWNGVEFQWRWKYRKVKVLTKINQKTEKFVVYRD